MGATATVRAIFDESAQNALVDDLAGTDPDQAESILANVPAIEGFSTSRSPGWWPNRLPQAADRITLSIADPVPLTDGPDPSTPEATPTTGDGE